MRTFGLLHTRPRTKTLRRRPPCGRPSALAEAQSYVTFAIKNSPTDLADQKQFRKRQTYFREDIAVLFSNKIRPKPTKAIAKAAATRRTGIFYRKGLFRFLDLPAELRNLVYEHVANDSAPTVKRLGDVASSSGMTRVSRQVHAEYQSVLKTKSQEIVVPVTELNFAPVVKFLDKLSDADLNRLPKVDGSNKERKVTVLLQISSDCINPGELMTWVRWLAQSNHRGANVDLTYKAEAYSYTSGRPLYPSEIKGAAHGAKELRR